MNKRNGLATKLISVVASLALVVGLMPLPAFAETASSQRLTLAAGELATTTGEPDAGDSGGSGYGLINGIPASDEGYVWIDSAGDSIRWHVIGANDSNYLLISADLLDGTMNWQGAKNYCNALFCGFSEQVSAAVPATSKSEPDDYRYISTSGAYFGPSSVNGEMFLLSAEEAETYFSEAADRKPGWWWLRSPNFSKSDCAGAVMGAGQLDADRYNNDEYDYQIGVRPAFQLHRASILFESAAENGKPDADGGFSEYAEPTTEADRKLTMLDESRASFTASSADAEVSPGQTATVSYSGAGAQVPTIVVDGEEPPTIVINNDGAAVDATTPVMTMGDGSAYIGTNEYVSAMLCDGDGTALYYASATPDSSGSGSWDLTIPGGIAEGSYTLKVFSEQRNGDKKTDYASSPVSIPLTVSNSAEITHTVTYKVVNGTWEDGTTEDKMEVVASGSSPASVPAGMVASDGYTGGTWDADPGSATITEDTTFTYSFDNDVTIGATGSDNYNLVNGIPASDEGYVWMGGGDNPIRWHIIGANDTYYLLVSADVLGSPMSWEAAKSYCDETVFPSFTAKEQFVVRKTTKSEPEDYQRQFMDGYFGPSTVSGNLFLLSAGEAATYFRSHGKAEPGGWWLRSPYTLGGDSGDTINGVGYIDSTGGLNVAFADRDDLGACPAFQLTRASVLFKSAAEGGKSSAEAGSGEYGRFLNGSRTDRKFTLLDTSRARFDASLTATSVARGGELAVSYSNAKTGENDYVSAMIKDAGGNTLYYASLTPDSSGSGTWSMTLPDDLANGSCALTVFSEQQNGDKKSDYASPMKTFELTVVDPDIEVSTWEELRKAVLGISPSGGLTNAKTIRLVGDIERPSDGGLIVAARQVTIDLNGHKLDRKQIYVDDNDGKGHVIEVRDGGILTITDGSSRKTGKITGGWAHRGGGIYICTNGTLNFDGGVLTNNRVLYDGGGIYVEAGGTLNLDGGTISGNTAESDGGGISVYGTLSAQDVSSDMFGPVGEQGSGGTIANNTAQETGGGIFVEESGAIFLYCANVSGNRAKDGGGGLNVHFNKNTSNSIAFCTITNNRSFEYGGGIRMYQDGGTLAVRGTAIEGNWAIDGGGVYVKEGKVAMSGGSVSGNTASGDGGGVKVHGGAEFEANDVAIQGNKATTGNGGGIKNDGTVTLSGCSITGNTACSYGGGIYVDDATTNIEGDLKVIDNSSDFGHDVYLCEGDKLTCVGWLTVDARIGVDLAKGTGTVTGGEYVDKNFSTIQMNNLTSLLLARKQFPSQKAISWA